MVVLDVNLDLLSEPHCILVNGVVNYLLEQHIDTIAWIAAVAQSANIHSRAAAYVLYAFQGLYVVVVVIYCLSHCCLFADYALEMKGDRFVVI